ncbi:hypothetical protein BCR42DRAFT_425877 [Absidia repens]|uniref:Uncharacterized protein n=1 Tax=Absidia repens TaxID=90262 RepID=A0A1X2I286_9FUNG|nr:hypothetical protein BCR42DRAFT_425877 [Absidia repens]
MVTSIAMSSLISRSITNSLTYLSPIAKRVSPTESHYGRLDLRLSECHINGGYHHRVLDIKIRILD